MPSETAFTTVAVTQRRSSQACADNGLKIIQVQVGHECDTSTAIYTHVSDDFMNAALNKALSPAFSAGPDREGGR